MTSPLSRALSGEVPARIVWQDELAAAMMAEQPVRPGHVIVFPRSEIDSWDELPAELGAHLFSVMQELSRAQRRVFPCEKVGVAFIGLVTRHAHAHLVPIQELADFDFAKQELHADPAALDAAASLLREALRSK